MKRTLKGIRNDLGLTQKQMADLIGVKEMTYQRYENYVTKIPVEVIARIMDVAHIESLNEIRYC